VRWQSQFKFTIDGAARLVFFCRSDSHPPLFPDGLANQDRDAESAEEERRKDKDCHGNINGKLSSIVSLHTQIFITIMETTTLAS
jgi:hypothetical protein